MEDSVSKEYTALASQRDRLSVALASAVAEIARLKQENEWMRGVSDPHDTCRAYLLQVAHAIGEAIPAAPLDTSFEQGVVAGRRYAIEQLEAAADRSGSIWAREATDQRLPRDEEFVKGMAVAVAILLRRAEEKPAKEIWDTLGLDSVPDFLEAYDAEPIKLALSTVWSERLPECETSVGVF